MPHDGAIIFSDLIGKLDVLRIECPKCGRAGRHRIADLIARYGHDEKPFAWTDAPRRDHLRRPDRHARIVCAKVGDLA
jgi:hypothetical protein